MKKRLILIFSIILILSLCSFTLLACSSFKEKDSSGVSAFTLSTSEDTCVITLDRYVHSSNRTTGNWAKVTSAKANGVDILTNYEDKGENNRLTHLTLDKGDTLTITVATEGFTSHSSLVMWEVIAGRHGLSSAILTDTTGADNTILNLNPDKGYYATKKGTSSEITLSYVVNNNMYLRLWAGRVIDFRLN